MNLQMEAALRHAEWNDKAVWGEGGHNGKHGGTTFPDTMRWIRWDWKDAK